MRAPMARRKSRLLGRESHAISRVHTAASVNRYTWKPRQDARGVGGRRAMGGWQTV